MLYGVGHTSDHNLFKTLSRLSRPDQGPHTVPGIRALMFTVFSFTTHQITDKPYSSLELFANMFKEHKNARRRILSSNPNLLEYLNNTAQPFCVPNMLR